jgi:transcription initiation factor TFIIIB Brf1 subunit/transcription initiation factor TFIIB
VLREEVSVCAACAYSQHGAQQGRSVVLGSACVLYVACSQHGAERGRSVVLGSACVLYVACSQHGAERGCGVLLRAGHVQQHCSESKQHRY